MVIVSILGSTLKVMRLSILETSILLTLDEIIVLTLVLIMEQRCHNASIKAGYKAGVNAEDNTGNITRQHLLKGTAATSTRQWHVGRTVKGLGLQGEC